MIAYSNGTVEVRSATDFSVFSAAKSLGGTGTITDCTVLVNTNEYVCTQGGKAIV